jgi:hypothetical protein
MAVEAKSSFEGLRRGWTHETTSSSVPPPYKISIDYPSFTLYTSDLTVVTFTFFSKCLDRRQNEEVKFVRFIALTVASGGADYFICIGRPKRSFYAQFLYRFFADNLEVTVDSKQFHLSGTFEFSDQCMACDAWNNFIDDGPGGSADILSLTSWNIPSGVLFSNPDIFKQQLEQYNF